MLRFVCDYCASVKEPGETWITGMAAENVGTQAARREVIIDPAWRYERAVLPLAVHFCCLDCKDSYLAELFDQPASLLEVERTGRGPVAGTRVIRPRKKPVSEPAQKRTTAQKRHLR